MNSSKFCTKEKVERFYGSTPSNLDARLRASLRISRPRRFLKRELEFQHKCAAQETLWRLQYIKMMNGAISLVKRDHNRVVKDLPVWVFHPTRAQTGGSKKFLIFYTTVIEIVSHYYGTCEFFFYSEYIFMMRCFNIDFFVPLGTYHLWIFIGSCGRWTDVKSLDQFDVRGFRSMGMKAVCQIQTEISCAIAVLVENWCSEIFSTILLRINLWKKQRRK